MACVPVIQAFINVCLISFSSMWERGEGGWREEWECPASVELEVAWMKLAVIRGVLSSIRFSAAQRGTALLALLGVTLLFYLFVLLFFFTYLRFIHGHRIFTEAIQVEVARSPARVMVQQRPPPQLAAHELSYINPDGSDLKMNKKNM